MTKQRDGLGLFSGGLDSILAMTMVRKQGLDVLGLHFLSPFFGKKGRISRWRGKYNLDIEPVDISQQYIDMMLAGPSHGFGKIINPCIDCKILMLARAREMMAECGAKFIVSGEVVGQRPMSQRSDALAAITRDAGVKGLLLRALCAKKMEPTLAEESGLVDREKLGDFSGRGRRIQLALAEEWGITEIPTPGGGCKLTEWESARRYFPLLVAFRSRRVEDYRLADTGRQVWSGDHMLATGRNEATNKWLERLALDSDLSFKVKEFPGPLGLGRKLLGGEWDPDTVRAAAAHVASYSSKAKRMGREVAVIVETRGQTHEVMVWPDRTTPLNWAEAPIQDLKDWRRNLSLKEEEDRKDAKRQAKSQAKSLGETE